jgi:hypothetical protein
MRGVLEERRWSAAEWARRAEVTPTNLTRFLREPGTASLPSAETIGRLAVAAGSEPRFLDAGRDASPAQQVPVLNVAEVRALRDLDPAAAERFLDGLARREGGPTVLVAGTPRRSAFALQLTTLHMNAAGMIPQDCVVLEPPHALPPRTGDLVVTVEGDHACGYRWHPPLLVPASTDSAWGPIEGAAVVGVAIQLVRHLRL